MVAEARSIARKELREKYESRFMAALAKLATPARHINVLQHIIGYFRKRLDDNGRRELHDLLDDYRRGLVPLIVPITMVRHYVRLFDITYLQGQVYLEPHPKELMLRNHV
jgi:uncharacterized protein YbgA (DUF1722 family)